MAGKSARPKRLRRRNEDKHPASARLVLPDHAKGDVGVISEALFAELFPSTAAGVSSHPPFNCFFFGSNASNPLAQRLPSTTMPIPPFTTSPSRHGPRRRIR
jgi:hypothetical protein